MSPKAFDGAALKLSLLLLDAAADPRQCSSVLRMLCRSLDAGAGQIALVQRPGNGLVALYSHGLEERARRTYAGLEDILDSDPRLRAAMRRPGQPALCHKILSEATLHRSELYRTILKPAGIEHSLVLPIVVDDEQFVLALTLMRGVGAAPFDDGDVNTLKSITPHLTLLSRAAAPRLLADDELTILRTMCERSVVAILVVDPRGRIVFENPAAREMLSRQGGLKRSDDRLTHSSAQQAQSIAAAISAQASGSQQSGSRHLLLPHGSGTVLHATFSLLPKAPGRAKGLADLRPNIVISLVDPMRTYEPDVDVLQVSFGLTAAEASILKLLAEGTPIGRIASLRGSAIGTVRNQINTIMSKTGTHRQTDLIRLALTAAPLFRGD